MVQKVPRSHQRLRRQSTHCHWCNQELASAPGYENSFTRDHVVPKSNGGSFRIQNIVASCERCNRYRGDMPAAEFARLITEYPLSPATEDLSTEKGRLRASWKHKHWREQWSGKTVPEPSLGAQLAAAINEPTEDEMQLQEVQEIQIEEPRVVVADDALSLYDVSRDDEEPRVRDIDLANRLGMRNPRKIRELIRAHWKKLNDINSVLERTQLHQGNGTAFTEYYLDRRQAMFLAARSNTPASDDVTMELVEVYDRWRKGSLPMHPTATANLAADATVAILTQIRDGVLATNDSIATLRDDHAARMAALERRIEGLETRGAVPLPAPRKRGMMRLGQWCDSRGVDYPTPGDLGRSVGTRIAKLARRAKITVDRPTKALGKRYPADFLDQHADQIRGWLS